MLWDTHMHTHHSGDSEASMENMIRASIQIGLEGICFTDHLDYDYPDDPALFLLDCDSYYNEIQKFQKQYQNIFPIHFGIELGLQPQVAQKNKAITQKYPFDFVIGSSHVVHGLDPYYAKYYEGRSEKEAYLEYFESILENLHTDADFDVYGHIDYVVRYGPNKNKFYGYREYADVIDEILKKIIDQGKGIELNTAGFKYGLGHPNPTEDILRRYHELGGEILTVGSDGHKPEHIAYSFKEVPRLLTQAGFSYYTVFEKRKPQFIALETDRPLLQF